MLGSKLGAYLPLKPCTYILTTACRQLTSTLAVPHSWITECSDIFCLEDAQSSDTHYVTVAHPICLQTVVFQPLTPSTLTSDGARLVDRLSESKRILHLGSLVSVNSEDDAANPESQESTFHVKMTEPVGIGYLDKTITRVVMIQHNILDPGSVTVDGNVSTLDEDDDESIYDIDERFLSNMIDSRVDAEMQVSNEIFSFKEL